MLGRLKRRVQEERTHLKRSRSLECDHIELGSGTPKDPFVLPLRDNPNKSLCYHCSEESCDCVWIAEKLRECYASLSVTRQVEQYRKRDLCAKSVLPPFVSRMIKVAKITSSDTFFDLGCGNGSVLFQVALMTGVKCVGVEINERNATVAKEAWGHLRPIFEARCGKTLEVDIICADFCSIMNEEKFFGSSPVIWVANLLLPKSVNHFLSERFRFLPEGSRILCLEDLYPHSRSVAVIRDPDAFDKFLMTDFKWQAMSVEWCTMEGSFYMYTRRS